MNLADLRLNYQKGELHESHVHPDPFAQFSIWFKEAQSAEVPEPNAMFLSTLSSSGRPSGRIVLLKTVDHGFSFFTNYESRKGQELAFSSQASITFFWWELERQIRIEGHVEKLSLELSTAYFHSRPRESQLGAWVSEQSARVDSREVLEKRYADLAAQYEGKTIPKPDHWGGYRLVPDYFEFWQGRSGRLHDRIIYTVMDGEWSTKRLQP